MEDQMAFPGFYFRLSILHAIQLQPILVTTSADAVAEIRLLMDKYSNQITLHLSLEQSQDLNVTGF